jgi:hypothetical protein
MRPRSDDRGNFSGAWPYADRYAQTRDDLQSVFEVVRPSNSRIKENCAAPFGSVGRDHSLIPANDSLQHSIEALMRQPHEALAEVVTERGGTLSESIVGHWNECCAEIPMRNQLIAQYQAYRHHGLESRTSCSAAQTGTAGRQ